MTRPGTEPQSPRQLANTQLIRPMVLIKIKKMVLDTSLLNTQHYKVHIKVKVEQSRERSKAFPYMLVQ